MYVSLSITGVFKTLLIIVGAFVVLRFLGQLMRAKRAMDEERKLNANNRLFEEEKRLKNKNIGKTEIAKGNYSKTTIEDVDFEEIKEE